MRKCIILIVCMALVSGCTKSNIVKPESKTVPNFDIIEGINLDNNQIREDLQAAISNYEDAAISVKLESSFDEDKSKLDLTLTVKDGTEPTQAVDFATYMIKAYSDAVSTQDFSYRASSEDTYGGYFDTNSIHVIVMEENSKIKPLVNQTIEAGTNAPLEVWKN